MDIRKNWDWFIVIIFSLIASWHYFWGTPHVLGIDYFIHLVQANIIQVGINEGTPIPAYHYLHGAGTTFIRYQGMLIAQMMGWCCYMLQILGLSDADAIMLVGRLFGILLNLGAGLAFHWAAKKIIKVYTNVNENLGSVALVATAAYIFGWSRWGVVLHVGSLQRAGALIFFPIGFSLVLTLLYRPLQRKEQILLALALAGCVMSHPGSFIYLFIISAIYLTITLIYKTPTTFANKSFPSWQLLWQKWRTLILPGVLSFCIAAWFLLPLLAEREYYGMMRRQKLVTYGVAWNEVLPAKYLQEFVNRENWFGDLVSDPKKGGSFLGGSGGVNSAYFGITVLLFVLLGLALPKKHALREISRITIIVALLILVIIFWRALRYNVFHYIGHHFTLPFYWLEPFYFVVCLCSLFGAFAVFEIIRQKIALKWAQTTMVLLALLVVLDFFSLVVLKNAAKIYHPKQGIQHPLGISWNHCLFDAYDALKKNARHGRVLDLPILNFNCNRLYHKHPDILAEEPNTDWVEAKKYMTTMRQEIQEAIDFSLVYSNRYKKYSLPQKEFESGDALLFLPKKTQWKTKPNWKGKTSLKVKFSLPMGIYNCWITFPIYLPLNSKVEAFYKDRSPIPISATNNDFNFYLTVPLQKKNIAKKTVEITLKIQKNNPEGALVVGVSRPPFIAYSGASLAYRLSILDLRYLALNLRYYVSTTSRLTNSDFIRKIYQSPTSVLYENILSTPFIFPEKAMLIQTQNPWKTFDDIAHHPNFNPHRVSFCYQGPIQDFDDVIQSHKTWQTKLVPLFLQKSLAPQNRAKIVHRSLESITYGVHMKKSGFFFPSLHFHPNLRALIDRKKSTHLYFSQAGMLAVKLPKGTHLLTVYYHHPWYDVLGKWLSFFTILGLILYVIIKGVKNLRKQA